MVTVDQTFESILSGLKIIDVDTHVMEPADLWTSRVSSKFGTDVPHVAVDAGGHPRWYVGGVPTMSAASLYSHPYYDEVSRVGGYDPHVRLEWMDRHGIHAQVMYPNLVGFHGSNFLALDEELRLECVRAYNDFQTDFSSVAPDRLIPLTNLPWWDVDASLAELERCHEMGHRGVNFGWRFEQVGYPPVRDPHWHPIFRTVEEMGWSMNFHIGFNGKADDDPSLQFDAHFPARDRAKFAAELFAGNIHCIAELIMSGLCDRYPTLRFVSVESGVGFLPFLVEALDWQFYAMRVYKDEPDMLLPSEYFKRQVYGCFWFEQGIGHWAEMYPDNFMFETDFNHSTSLTPADEFPEVKSPRDTLAQNLGGAPEPLVRKLLQDNAARVYGLEPSPVAAGR